MDTEEERIALFLDYENLAIGARESLHGMQFDLRPVLDALAERGRVIARKAYADWSYFDEDRRMLTRSHVELIEIPQRMGAVRKNAADIKLSVDALEMAFERDYVTTFVICTGDSDFTPLVHKLRELNKRVIGVGIKDSTSALLPPACDEFLFYDTLEGVDVPVDRPRKKRTAAKPEREPAREPEPEVAAEASTKPGNVDELAVLIAQTLAGLQRSSSGPVLASSIKRALLRKDPTFSEAEYGFRAFGELLRHLTDRNVIELTEGSAKAIPRSRSRRTAARRTRSACCAPWCRTWRARRSAPLVGTQEQAPQGPAGLQREEVRLPGLPAVREGGRDAGDRPPRLGRRGGGLHRDGREPVARVHPRADATDTSPNGPGGNRLHGPYARTRLPVDNSQDGEEGKERDARTGGG